MKVQKIFLEELKKISHHADSFTEEMASVLQLSTDSTYRRIRGETLLTLEEVQKLCAHYRFSIDNFLLSTSSDRVLFRHRPIDYRHHTLLDWIKRLRRNFLRLHEATDKEILYSGKDIPLLYYFQSAELASFKMYFWMKSMFYYPAYQTGKFKRSIIPAEYLHVVSDIWQYYTQIDSTEIWTEDCVNITLSQIEYYDANGFFHDPSEAADLCEILSSLLKKAKNWAAAGSKGEQGGKLNLYKNEILFSDNTVLFKTNNQRTVFIPHSMIEVISTSQEPYCEQTERDMLTYVDRSVVISTTGEKERNKFFNALDARISSAKERMASDSI